MHQFLHNTFTMVSDGENNMEADTSVRHCMCLLLHMHFLESVKAVVLVAYLIIKLQ